jgi:hypothetical protein
MRLPNRDPLWSPNRNDLLLTHRGSRLGNRGSRLINRSYWPTGWNTSTATPLFTRSPTGFSNEGLGLVCLKHFDKFTMISRKGSYSMLLFDGHGSHLTQDFIDYCWENKIRPYRFPAHLTHLLQLLDVGVFQGFKHNFKKRYGGRFSMARQRSRRPDSDLSPMAACASRLD